jgi:MraZ protein
VLFLGTFDYAMDERGRVPLPPRYRDAFRDGIVLSQGSPDACLRVFTRVAFDAEAEQFTSEPAAHRKGRVLRRSLFSRAHETELDGQNRVLIPQPLRDYARLSTRVLVVGAGECLEIWSPEAYEAEMARVDEQIEHTLESVERPE